MLRFLIVGSLLAIATLASADCTVNSIMTDDGRILTCVQCCIGGSCSTTCTR